MLNYADRAAFSSVLPPLRNDLRLSDTELGLLSSLFLWSYALAGPVAGIMADRYSRSSLVIWSLVAWSAITFLTGVTNGLIMLIVLRTGLGVSQSLYLPAGLALIADTNYNVFFFLFGEGGCGKSVYLHVLVHLVGERNCCCLPLASFGEK